MTVDPSDVADQLPERPLTPDEADAITDRLGWSAMPVTYETDGGTSYVPAVYCYDEDDRRALSLRLEDGAWVGTVDREDVDRDTWLKVNQAMAAEMGGDVEIKSLEFDDGSTREFDG